MNAEKFNLDRIYFSGCFIRGHRATIATLSYAIRFWSKGSKRAFFLRHEGYLGAVGAWIKHVSNDGAEGSNNHNNSSSSIPSPSAPISATKASFEEVVNHHHRTRSLSSRPESMPTPVAEVQEPRAGESGSGTPLTGINGIHPDPMHSMPPMLAEALGGASLDDGPRSNGAVHSDELQNVTVGPEDEEEIDGEQEADAAALLESLSAEDRALLAPMLLGPGEDGGSGAKMSVAELLAKMDAASGAADGLEDKLDRLLSKLDGMLLEEESTTAADTRGR